MSKPPLLNQVTIEDWAGEKGRNQAKEGKCALPISAQTGVHYQIGHVFKSWVLTGYPNSIFIAMNKMSYQARSLEQDVKWGWCAVSIPSTNNFSNLIPKNSRPT